MMQFYREFLKIFDRLDTQQWLVVLVIAVVVGMICLRGMGSRSSF
jgi:hypothetical protein